MNKYEVMYVIDPTLEDSVRNELISYFSGIVEKNAGMIDRIDEWGKRRLAYAINYKTEGYYVLMTFVSGPAFPRELDRKLRIAEGVMRSLIVCKGE